MGKARGHAVRTCFAAGSCLQSSSILVDDAAAAVRDEEELLYIMCGCWYSDMSAMLESDVIVLS